MDVNETLKLETKTSSFKFQSETRPSAVMFCTVPRPSQISPRPRRDWDRDFKTESTSVLVQKVAVVPCQWKLHHITLFTLSTVSHDAFPSPSRHLLSTLTNQRCLPWPHPTARLSRSLDRLYIKAYASSVHCFLVLNTIRFIPSLLPHQLHLSWSVCWKSDVETCLSVCISVCVHLCLVKTLSVCLQGGAKKTGPPYLIANILKIQ